MPENPVAIGPYRCGIDQPLLVIAGPCVIEDEATTLSIARALQEIAGRLVISEKTVKNHINNIFSKLHFQDRSQAMLYAIRKGLVKVD